MARKGHISGRFAGGAGQSPQRGAGWIVLFLGAFRDGEEAPGRMRDLYMGLGDDEGLASSLNFLGVRGASGEVGEDIPVAALLEEVLGAQDADQ